MAKPEDKTVLVVDDEADVREFLSEVLTDAGFNVVTAGDGVEALEQVRAQRPDFISLDLVMPKKSGMKFLYELRHHREWEKIPVLIVTAHANDELGRGELQGILAGGSLTGSKVYLEKPIQPEAYVRAVCDAVGVEPPDESTATRDDLRQQAERLVQGASDEQLAKIVALLRTSR